MDENKRAGDSSLAAYLAVLAGAFGGLIIASHSVIDLDWPTVPHKAAAIFAGAILGTAIGLGVWYLVISRRI